MDRRSFLGGAAAAAVGVLVPEKAFGQEPTSLSYTVWPQPADSVVSRYQAYFTGTFVMNGGAKTEDHDLNIGINGTDYLYSPSLGFHCLMTSSRPGIHALPRVLRGVTGTDRTDALRPGGMYRWIRVRFTMHDGSVIPRGAVVRVWVNMLGHWY